MYDKGKRDLPQYSKILADHSVICVLESSHFLKLLDRRVPGADCFVVTTPVQVLVECEFPLMLEKGLLDLFFFEKGELEQCQVRHIKYVHR